MDIEELKKHCEKQVERCRMFHDSKHEAEHQIVLYLIKENQKYKEVIEKIRKEMKGEYSIMGVKVVENWVLEDILKEVE